MLEKRYRTPAAFRGLTTPIIALSLAIIVY